MNGSIETIRFIGVDTPETHKPDTVVQCYGPEATDYTKGLIGKQKVRLQADPLNTNRDRYGRLLRYVYLPDNTLLEQKLLSEGYGFAYTFFPLSKAKEFETYELQAKTAGKGLWSACQVKIEVSGVKQTNPVQGNPTQLAHVQQRRLELWTCTHSNKSHQKLKFVNI